MFKYYYNSPKEESVYNLVAGEFDKNGSTKDFRSKKNDNKNRYRSIYSTMVREEADRCKAWSAKTMGVPRLSVEGPDMFLKKQSKRPLSMRPKSVGNVIPRERGCQTDENEEARVEQEVTQDLPADGEMKEDSNLNEANIPYSKGRPKTCYQRLCLSTAKKPPIPESRLGVNFVIQESKDFIHSNAQTAISAPPSKPKEPLYVDTPKGEKRQWRNSGLAPQYIHKKNFAQVPVYITLRKKEFLDQIKKKQEEEQEKASNSQVRILNIEERDKVIEGLKQNWNEIFSFYQRLPLLIDTPGKIKRKTSMEDQMKKLEIDIQTLQRHDSIYVSDIAPRSFYAYNGNRKAFEKHCK